MVNMNGFPLFNSSSLQLWPILIRFSSFKPAPVALYCCYKKPDMEKLLSEPLVVIGSSYELFISTLTCDAPARALLKEIVQNTGYYACGRCTSKGTCIRGRMR